MKAFGKTASFGIELFIFECGFILRRIAADEWVLLKIDNLTADRPAFVGQPINDGRCDFMRFNYPTCWSEDFW